MTEKDIYPLVIINDRYSGTYSKGAYTAWNHYLEQIPKDIDDGDPECWNFWDKQRETKEWRVGVGATVKEAIKDLERLLDPNYDEYKGVFKVDGLIDTEGELTEDTFTSRFIEWVESNGWSYAGGIGTYIYKEEDDGEPDSKIGM